MLPTFLDLQLRFWLKAVHDLLHMHTVLTCLFTSEESSTFCVDALRNVLAHVLIAERAIGCHECTHDVLLHAVHHVAELSVRTTGAAPIRCIVRHVIFVVINIVLILQ